MFSKAPHFTEVITGALHDDGSTDLAVYVPAVVRMGAAGQTAFVLMSWARILAWAHGDGARALRGCAHSPRVDQATLAHGVRLVDCAARGHLGVLMRQTQRSVRELGSQRTWGLIACLVWPTRTVIDTVGGHARLQNILTVLEPAATKENLPTVAGPLALALGAMSRGAHHAAATYLATLVNTASMDDILAVLLRALAIFAVPAADGALPRPSPGRPT